jgi:hypothetical protein
MESLVRTAFYKRLLSFQRRLKALPQRCITLHAQTDVNIPCHPDSNFALEIMGEEKWTLATYAVGDCGTRSRSKRNNNNNNNVEDRRCHVVSVTDPYGRILAFYTGTVTFSFK